jgi:hypothetical protein
MDKVKLEIKTPKNKTIEHNGTEITVMPFLTFVQQMFLIEKYVEEFFGTPELIIEISGYHYLEAQIKLINLVFQLCTNIDMDGVDDDIYVDHALWQKVTDNILNWCDFERKLEKVVYETREQKKLDNQIGKVISDLVEKAYSLLDKFSSMNPEEIKKAGETGLQLIKRLEKSSVLNNPADKVLIAENAGLVPKEPVKKKRTRAKKVAE